MDFTDHDLPGTGVAPATCPFCGMEVDGAAGLTSDNAPKDGDVMLCFYCAEVAVYRSDGLLYEPTLAESEDFGSDRYLTDVQATLRAYLDRHPEVDQRTS